jgi:Ca2+/H+ antiporter, TMEM165/GDT1 family
MKLRQRHAHLLLLALPSLVGALAAPAPDVTSGKETGPAVGSVVKARYDVGTKAAPVDGKDGMPHEGPFVDTDRKKDVSDGEAKKDLPPLKGRPEDPTIVNGQKIPDVNDGVMDDRNRPPPKEGTTGTEGGVSEKDKARKAKEGITGEKVEKKPETPKEAPPLPHSEEEKILSDKESKKETTKEKTKGENKSTGHVGGFEVWTEKSNSSLGSPQLEKIQY